MDLGLVTFADLYPGVTPEQRMQNLIEEARLADELGLTVFAVGEHHRPDYLVSSPTTALAAIAAVTKQIRLASAVSVLSSDDPVRVFQQFAHVDLISGGRAEIRLVAAGVANVPRELDPADPLAGLPGNPQTVWKRRALETLVERATVALG